MNLHYKMVDRYQKVLNLFTILIILNQDIRKEIRIMVKIKTTKQTRDEKIKVRKKGNSYEARKTLN